VPNSTEMILKFWEISDHSHIKQKMENHPLTKLIKLSLNSLKNISLISKNTMVKCKSTMYPLMGLKLLFHSSLMQVLNKALYPLSSKQSNLMFGIPLVNQPLALKVDSDFINYSHKLLSAPNMIKPFTCIKDLNLNLLVPKVF